MSRVSGLLVLVGLLVVGVVLGSGDDVGRDASVSPAVETPSSPAFQRVVTATSLRVRAGPGTDSAIKTTARQGTRVTVLRTEGAWVEARLPTGETGWMHASYLGSRTAPPRQGDVVGRAHVTDGDTIRIGAVDIRLEGIDAPESGQSCEDATGRLYPCGGRSANALADLVGQKTVACRRDDIDRYGRTVGTCVLASSGESLNATMVESGWALAYRRYSQAYVPDEARAKRAGAGLWQGRFVAPWDFRRGARLQRRNAAQTPLPLSDRSTARTATPDGACRIKGNITTSGRIYHLPGSKWYAKTRIDTGVGERWFCSEAEARAAGWRAARG